MCRWGVESLLFPELTANLSTGFYTRGDIEHLVAYALDRGVRIVPEFDMPGVEGDGFRRIQFLTSVCAVPTQPLGHAAGLLPLQGRGVEFCNAPGTSSIPNWCTLKGGNGSVAQKLLPLLVSEMVSLFNQTEIFHIGEALLLLQANFRSDLPGLYLSHFYLLSVSLLSVSLSKVGTRPLETVTAMQTLNAKWLRALRMASAEKGFGATIADTNSHKNGRWCGATRLALDLSTR
jgi:hypothetical protein